HPRRYTDDHDGPRDPRRPGADEGHRRGARGDTGSRGSTGLSKQPDARDSRQRKSQKPGRGGSEDEHRLSSRARLRADPAKEWIDAETGQRTNRRGARGAPQGLAEPAGRGLPRPDDERDRRIADEAARERRALL